MKTLVLAALLLSSAFGQTLSVSVSTPTAKPGQTVTVVVSFAPGSTGVAAMGWQLAMSDPSLQVGPTSASGAATVAGKVVSCNPNTSSPPCVAWGMNQNNIGAGPVATTSYVIPSNATPGPVTFSILSPSGSTGSLSPTALMAVPILVGPNATLTIQSGPSPYDLNGDGKVDILDVQIVVSQVIGTAVCSTGDVDKSGKCDLIDVQTVVRAALGQ